MLDTTLGRFTSLDRLGFDAGDLNLYRYVNNGFVNATDPSGMFEREGTLALLRADHPEIYRWFVDRGAMLAVKDLNYLERRNPLVKNYSGYINSNRKPVLSIYGSATNQEAVAAIKDMVGDSLLEDAIYSDFKDYKLGKIEDGLVSASTHYDDLAKEMSAVTLEGAKLALSYYTTLSNGASAAELVIRIASGDVAPTDLLLALPATKQLGRLKSVTVRNKTGARTLSKADTEFLNNVEHMFSWMGKKTGALKPSELLEVKKSLEKASNGKYEVIIVDRHTNETIRNFLRDPTVGAAHVAPENVATLRNVNWPGSASGKGVILLRNEGTTIDAVAHETLHMFDRLLDEKWFRSATMMQKEESVLKSLLTDRFWPFLTKSERDRQIASAKNGRLKQEKADHLKGKDGLTNAEKRIDDPVLVK